MAHKNSMLSTGWGQSKLQTHGATFLITVCAKAAEVESSSTFAMLRTANSIL